MQASSVFSFVLAVSLPAALVPAALVPAALAPSSAAAQGGHGGVASSGMGQGQARISSRSDVRLSMESMRGTSGAAVSALGTRVGARMATIRGCYETVVAENPGVTGTLRMRILLEARGRPTVEVDRDGVNEPSLLRCITAALTAIDTAQLTRPTHAIVQLEMGNSAAAGAARVQQRAQEARQVTVTMNGDNPTTTGSAQDRGVRFTVTGQGRDSAGAVVAAHRAVVSVMPGLMDCRRRAGRRGQRSGGTLTASMQVRDGRPPTARVTRSTVPNEQARSCVSRVMRRIEGRTSGGSGTVAVSIEFTDADVAEARR